MPGDVPGPPLPLPGMPGPMGVGVDDFGVNPVRSLGRSGGLLYPSDGFVNSSAGGLRISRLGEVPQPADATTAAATISQKPFMGKSSHVRVDRNRSENSRDPIRFKPTARYLPALASANRSCTAFQFTVFHHAST